MIGANWNRLCVLDCYYKRCVSRQKCHRDLMGALTSTCVAGPWSLCDGLTGCLFAALKNTVGRP